MDTKRYGDDAPPGKGTAKKPRSANKAMDAPGFESAMAELEEILDKLSTEGTTLDESIALYARAAELIKQCGEILRAAKIRVDEITESMQSDGAEEFDDL